MKRYVLLSLAALVFVSCSDAPQTADGADSVAIPDSVPQRVVFGEDANWAYKPDTMINDLLIGDAQSLTDWKRVNGNEGAETSGRSEMVYVNALETEQLTVFQIVGKSTTVVYGFRVKKNVRDKKSPPASNYSVDRNFLTSAGIYIGMPAEYVQRVYTGQAMMRWVEGDTTYLEYMPAEKDKSHFKRYTYSQYKAQYKFVDDKCVLYETFVQPEAFTEQ